MMSDAVLLLGGGGFIGTVLACHLAAMGRQVHVVTRRPASADFISPPCSQPRLAAPHGGGVGLGRPSADFSSIQFHAGNLQDRALLARLLPVCGTVIHLASETTPGVSARCPTLEAGNLLPTLGLLEMLQEFPAIHLIYLSSGGTLYGSPDKLPVAEDAPLSPQSYHGAGKAAQEMFLQAFRAQGCAVTTLRPANAYGPGQSLRTGFGLVRTVMECIRRDLPLEIWGDGEAVRDYVYVDDVAAACALFVARPDDNSTYNVGSGEGCSINELIRRAGKVCGRMPRVEYRPARTGDVARVVLDITRLRAAGWVPKVSLDAGLQQTWAWLQDKSDCLRV